MIADRIGLLAFDYERDSACGGYQKDRHPHRRGAQYAHPTEMPSSRKSMSRRNRILAAKDSRKE